MRIIRMENVMTAIADLILWPGTQLCKIFGINPTDEMGLLRSFFNMLVWLPLGLIIVTMFVG